MTQESLREHLEKMEKVLQEAGYSASVSHPLQIWNQGNEIRVPLFVYLPLESSRDEGPRE